MAVRNVPRKNIPTQLAGDYLTKIRPSILPKASHWQAFAENINFLAGHGNQTGPSMCFGNNQAYISGVSAFEIPVFINPNCLSYEVSFELGKPGVSPFAGQLSASFGRNLSGVTEFVGGIPLSVAPAFGGHFIKSVIHRGTQANSQSWFMAMPVTMSYSISSSFLSSNQFLYWRSLSFREIPRRSMNVEHLGGFSQDYPSVDPGSLARMQYVWAQNPDTTVSGNAGYARASVNAIDTGISACLQIGARSAGLFYWTYPWTNGAETLLTGSGLGLWSADSLVPVPFITNTNVSCSIYPTTLYSGQVIGSMNYAFFVYSFGGSSATTASIRIVTSTGETKITCPVGTGRQWFTGNFSGFKVNMTGSAYLPIGNTLSEKFSLHLSRSAGAGTVYVGSVLIGEANTDRG